MILDIWEFLKFYLSSFLVLVWNYSWNIIFSPSPLNHCLYFLLSPQYLFYLFLVCLTGYLSINILFIWQVTYPLDVLRLRLAVEPGYKTMTEVRWGEIILAVHRSHKWALDSRLLCLFLNARNMVVLLAFSQFVPKEK